MKDQRIMTEFRSASDTRRGIPGGSRALPGVMLLALGLVCAVWAFGYFRAEARLRRASLRLVQLVEKAEAESPVAMGLSAHRLGGQLADAAVLEYGDDGPVATGRRDIVQLFTQIRSLLARIELDGPKAAVRSSRRGEIVTRVTARYRLVSETGSVEEGEGAAELTWRKGEDGWRIERAVIRAEDGARFPGDW